MILLKIKNHDFDENLNWRWLRSFGSLDTHKKSMYISERLKLDDHLEVSVGFCFCLESVRLCALEARAEAEVNLL